MVSLLANLVVLHSDHLFIEGGIVSDVFSVFVVNAILPLIFSLLNPEYFFQKIQQKRCENNQESLAKTQAEMNKLFEGPALIMSNEYAAIVNTLWFSLFYVMVLPVGIAISLVGVVLYYFANKYLIVRRYSRPQLLSTDLNSKMVELLELCPFIMAV